MAEIITDQDMRNAKRDIEDIGKSIGTETLIRPRSGSQFKSIPLVSRELLDNGGYRGFANETELKAYRPTVLNSLAKDLETKKIWCWETRAPDLQPKWHDTGKSDLDLAKEFAEENPLFKPVRLDTPLNIDELITQGFYLVPTDIIAKALKLPSGLHGTLFSSGYTKPPKNGFVFHTYIDRYGGVFFRTKEINGWSSWSGNTHQDLSLFLELGQVNQKIIKDISELSGHLDKALDNGLYQVNTSSVASWGNGFPITASGGFLTIKRNASGAIHQMWETYGGYAFRWGALTGATATWQPWRGFKNTTNSIIDVSKQVIEKELIVYGSSTLEYLSDELADLANRKGLVFKDKALSGETVNGAGFAMGANEVKITFPSGSILRGKNLVKITQSMAGRAIHKTTPVELSNGVTGNLTYDSTTKEHFVTVTGYFENISDIAEKEFDAIVPDWYNQIDGVIIINIGKNNVGYDSLETILSITKTFIDYLPKDSKFIVGGHFSNTNATDSTRDIVEEINAFLESNYGLKYFDINKLLFDESTWTRLGLTKTDEDIRAIERRCKPPSLSRDVGHLSAEMDVILAEEIERTLVNLKYI